MADKEERILVLTTHNKDGECECVMQDGCHANDSCDICNVGMTREQILDVMAKAFYAENVVRCNSDDCPPGSETCDGCPTWENCEHLAKIALNALLGYKK